MAEDKIAASPALPTYYMRLTQDQADARLGKLRDGDIIAMPADKAGRWLTARVAVQASEREYNEQQDRRNTRSTAAQNAYRAINEGGAVWDVSTYRDVMTAPEGGLRLAVERGIPLVNVHMLRDEDGDPLPPDADIDDILDARANLHPDIMSPLGAHDRSSVMGGGSPYVSNMAGPQPLSPQLRAAQQRVAYNETMAQQPAGFSYDRRDPGAQRDAQKASAAGSERANRAERRATPNPPLSPEAGKAAADAGVQPPKATLNAGQKA